MAQQYTLRNKTQVVGGMPRVCYTRDFREPATSKSSPSISHQHHQISISHNFSSSAHCRTYILVWFIILQILACCIVYTGYTIVVILPPYIFIFQGTDISNIVRNYCNAELAACNKLQAFKLTIFEIGYFQSLILQILHFQTSYQRIHSKQFIKHLLYSLLTAKLEIIILYLLNILLP